MKKIIILFIAVIITLGLSACEPSKSEQVDVCIEDPSLPECQPDLIIKDELLASLSDPDGIYFSLDNGVEVTNQELWDVMKSVEGIQYLEEYVDRILLADYISDITQEQINNEILKLKYGTSDLEIIAEIQAKPYLNDRYMESFLLNVKLLGYDPEDTDDLKAFVELGLAKRNYTVDLILAGTDEDLVITSSMLVGYYEYINVGSVCTIDLRFSNSNEASSVFDLFNLVPTYTNDDGTTGFGLYNPNLNLDTESNPIDITSPILKKSDFTDENTTLLTDDEVFTYYIKMWNHLNQYDTPISESETRTSFCTNYPEIGVKVYSEMVKGKQSSDPYVSYANKIFTQMDLNIEGLTPYSYSNTSNFGEFTILTYKIEQDELLFKDLDFVFDTESLIESVLFLSTEAEAAAAGLEFVGLTKSEALQLFKQTLAEPLREEFITEILVTDEVVNGAILKLRIENNLTISDPHMRLQLQSDADSQQAAPLYTLNNDGSETYIATTDTINITPDDLLAFMIDRVGVFYAIELGKTEIIINSAYYIDLFGDSEDILNSDNENMIEIFTEIEQIRTSFLGGLYAQYGFNPTQMTWEEFMYLAFQLPTVEDIALNIFAIGEIKPSYINDHVVYETAIAYMEDQVNRYLSLNVTHLLLYVDRDFDFQPDDYSDFLDGLTVDENVLYDVLVAQFENDVLEQLEIDGNSFTTIVSDFKNTVAGDGSIWAPYKEFGFFIQTQNLGEVDHNSISNFDEAFGDEVIRLYNYYTDVNVIDRASLLSDRTIESDFGIHLLDIRKGVNFEIPTAVYNYIDANEEVGTYVDGSEGTSIIPTKAQVEAYIAIQDAIANGETPDKLLPVSVTKAVEYYFGPIYNAYHANTGFGIVIADFMLANGLEFNADNNAELIAKLEDILEGYYEISFPELYERTTE